VFLKSIEFRVLRQWLNHEDLTETGRLSVAQSSPQDPLCVEAEGSHSLLKLAGAKPARAVRVKIVFFIKVPPLYP
jgi:hypothetical protein